MLRKGSLQQFLAGIGRMDLAKAAQQAAAQPDPDIALDEFLEKLPTREVMGPRLDLVPRRLSLGRCKVGESRQYPLKILNQGIRLLHGKLQVEGGEWLSFSGSDNGSIPIKAGKQQQLTLQIDTFGLPAGQRYAAKLTVITNGGVVEVPVTMDLAPAPFPHPPLQGANNPRDLAAKMKPIPKQAAPLLENGTVQQWFAANGWSYPITGAPAKGIAAVQQFFEGLGLSKPPPLTLSSREVFLVCRAGQTVQGQVVLQTPVKKWVYARVESDRPWLTVLTPDVGGAQQAKIEFEVSGRELGNGRHEGHLTIVANGGQKLTVTVAAEVRTVRVPASQRVFRYALIGALAGLLLRLLASVPDLYARGLGSFGAWLLEPPEHYIQRFALVTAWLGVPLGGWLLWRRSGVRDVPAGMLVGLVTGLAASVTLASVLIVLDRLVWWVVPLRVAGMALVGWTVLGAAGGLILSALGSAGQALVSRVGQTLGTLARKLGLGGLAELLGE
jgi:hypothetical protein